MDPKLRIVTQLRLSELWRDDGVSTKDRGRLLTAENVRTVLASGPVQFVGGNVGSAPLWIPLNECFHFWKHEVKPNLASETTASLDEFAGRYCYFASQWGRRATAPIVLLEK